MARISSLPKEPSYLRSRAAFAREHAAATANETDKRLWLSVALSYERLASSMGQADDVASSLKPVRHALYPR